MGAQRLGPKKIRRLAEVTGLEVVRAWAHGGYEYNFVTADHTHYWFDLKTGEWEQLPPDHPMPHYQSCRELFGD